MPAAELSVVCPSCETPFVATVVLANPVGHVPPPVRTVRLVCLRTECRHQFNLELDVNGRLLSNRPMAPEREDRRPVPLAGAA